LNAFRIVQDKFSVAPYSYGLKSAGRWHPKGTPMVYAASSIALAMVEYLCIKGPGVLTSRWALLIYNINGQLPSLDITSLPLNWAARAHSKDTQEIGKQWILSNEAPAMKIPSARLPLFAYPEEFNLLINPLHPALQEEVSIVESRPLRFHLGDWGG
jgi:RES domain-containing protein